MRIFLGISWNRWPCPLLCPNRPGHHHELIPPSLSTSYWQTIHAYPGGGGAYTVAKENLGTLPGSMAGASLLVGYVLTVAVSVAAGVAAITSAFPSLYPPARALS